MNSPDQSPQEVIFQDPKVSSMSIGLASGVIAGLFVGGMLGATGIFFYLIGIVFTLPVGVVVGGASGALLGLLCGIIFPMIAGKSEFVLEQSGSGSFQSPNAFRAECANHAAIAQVCLAVVFVTIGTVMAIVKGNKPGAVLIMGVFWCALWTVLAWALGWICAKVSEHWLDLGQQVCKPVITYTVATMGVTTLIAAIFFTKEDKGVIVSLPILFILGGIVGGFRAVVKGKE